MDLINNINYKVIFIILMSSILLGFIYNTFSTDGIDFIRKPIIIKSVQIGESDEYGDIIGGIDLAQALQLFEDKSAIFVDARDQWEFSKYHIDGAVNIPEFSFTKEDSILNNISSESLLVIYCDGDDCDISKRLAQEFIKLGYKNTYVFLGGMKSWVEAKLPITGDSENE